MNVGNIKPANLLWVAWLFGLLAYGLSASPGFAALSVKNTSKYMGDGRWNWTIYVDADPRTLNRIKCVEYTLHPTFPKPVREICDSPQTRFGLTTNGWGTFTVGVRVSFEDGSTQNLDHRLVFEERRGDTALRIEAKNWAREIEPGWWEWGIYVEGRPSDLDRIKCVEYTLHRTFPNPVRLVCSRANKFQLTARGWGTFALPIKIILKDGSIHRLNHLLQFR